MRLAANEIERSLQQAADERRLSGERLSAAQLDARAEDLRSARESLRQPFGRGTVRGFKDGVDREVLTTQFTEQHAGRTYRWVLRRFEGPEGQAQEYGPSRMLYRRMRWNAKTQEFTPDPDLRWGAKRPPRQSLEASGIDTKVQMPYGYHYLLVREDRIRR